MADKVRSGKSLWRGVPRGSAVPGAASACRLLVRRLVVLALAGGLISAPASADFNAYGTITSEYIYRGLSVSGGNPALQLAVDYQHESGVFAGAWASRVRLRTERSSRDLELDLYAGYHHDGPGRWSGTITLMRYTYPGTEGDFDYDHNEWLFSAQWAQRVRLDLGYTADVYGTGRTARHAQLGAYWPVGGGWTVSGALGRNDLSSLGVGRYYHWDLGASASYSRLTLDVRWYDNESIYSGGWGGQAAGSRLAVSLSAAF